MIIVVKVLLQGTIVNKIYGTDINLYMLNHFYQQYLVLLTMAPRNNITTWYSSSSPWYRVHAVVMKAFPIAVIANNMGINRSNNSFSACGVRYTAVVARLQVVRPGQYRS